MRRRYPHLIVLQHDSFSSGANTVIAPLAPPLISPASRSYPLLDFADTTVMMLTADLAVVARQRLGQPVANLADQRARIIGAIDMLFAGS
jgi:hypothetical protein